MHCGLNGITDSLALLTMLAPNYQKVRLKTLEAIYNKLQTLSFMDLEHVEKVFSKIFCLSLLPR